MIYPQLEKRTAARHQPSDWRQSREATLTTGTPRAPVSDRIIHALARLIDDSMAGYSREPTHSQIESQIRRAGLEEGDPNKQDGKPVGKAKRIRGTLTWALENHYDRTEMLVAYLLSLVQACGGFRNGSENFVGSDAIEDLRQAFQAEGYSLGSDGTLVPTVLESLSGVELTDALRAYVRRAQRGVQDAALLTGTSKDLLEAIAAHAYQQVSGNPPPRTNFPGLLGMAFVTLGLATPHDASTSGGPSTKRVERAMYDLGCAVNGLRNKEGTGHGRPWLPSITDAQARSAVQSMGLVAEMLLAALDARA